jgi:hypothetical protein
MPAYGYTQEDLRQWRATRLNEHLASGGVIQVATYCKAWLYSKRHAGWFTEDANGNLYVQHGRGRNCLSHGDRLLVSIRFQ